MRKFTLLSLLFATAVAFAQNEVVPYTLKYCGNLYNWNNMQDEEGNPMSGDVTIYIPVSADDATKIAGNKITSVAFSVLLNGTDTEATKQGTVFVTEDLNGEAASEMKLTIRNSYGISPNFYQTAAFSRNKQYVIKENTPFYFGIKFHCDDTDLPIAIDDQAVSRSAGFVEYRQDGELVMKVDVGEDLESNLFMFAETVGESGGIENVFAIHGMSIGDWENPVFNNEHARPVILNLENRGSNALTSVEYTYSCSGSSETVTTAEINVPAGKTLPVELPINYLPGRNELTIEINKVNGQPTIAGDTFSYFNIGDGGYPAKFVVEEGTGSWCSWCPLGIWAFDYLSEKYPDTFVPIAVHVRDAYTAMSYSSFANTFSGYPMSHVNRWPGYHNISPDPYDLEAIYKRWEGQMCPGNVFLDIEVTDSKINVNSTTFFDISDSHKYTVAYVLLEDKLPGTQNNNYAGGYYGECGGWEKLGSAVEIDYMHVARDIKDDYGYSSATIYGPQANRSYDCSLSFNIKAVENVDNSYVVALLIDLTEDGSIVNATTKRIKEGTGVESIIDDSNAPVEYFTTQGVRVQEPEAGHLYIRKQGTSTSKVLMK
ncbi:MAG: hypothetical protein HUK12_00745 [Muribaculaceae bacterium]|nr:hypothetical protein [Muribaculaceae bacterium]